MTEWIRLVSGLLDIGLIPIRLASLDPDSLIRSGNEGEKKTITLIFDGWTCSYSKKKKTADGAIQEW